MKRRRTSLRWARAFTPLLALSALLVALPASAEPAAASFAPVVAAPAAAAFPLETPLETPAPEPAPANAGASDAPAEPSPPPPAAALSPAPSPTTGESKPVWRRLPPLRPSAGIVPDRDAVRGQHDDDDARERWMLSLEGVTRAPIDAGAQLVIETPIGLRIGGGYGVIPGPYLNLMSNVVALTAADEATPSFESGRVLRAHVGLRPFRYFGAYVDAGYARANLDGHLSGGGAAAGQGAFSMELHMWFAELGYQSLIADRIVVAIGIGVTGVMDARTSADASGADAELASGVLESADGLIEDYGYVPTLTIRLGVDMI